MCSENTKPQKSKRAVLLRRVLLVVIGLVLGIQVYQWNANTLAGNSLPMPFGVGTAVVMSGSMEPTLSVDDLVIIRDTGDYEVGDVVVYQSGQKLVIHRIERIEDQRVTTRGDANDTSDLPIAMHYIKGEMVLAIPQLGGAFRSIKNLPVALAILIVAIVLMELSWKNEKTKDEEELDSIKAEIRKLQAELNDSQKG